MTGRRALSSAVARRLAAVATSGSWTRAAIAQRFEEIGTPDADRIATRLFDLLPTPPVEGVDSVYRLLSELPHIDEPAPVVEQPDHEWRFDVPKWTHTVAVAQAVGLTPAELDWFADPGEWLRNKAPTLQHYRYRIRSDHRLLEAPKERLREVQRRILRGLLDRVPPHAAAHGFVRGRSVHTFAAPHAGRDVVVRIDLRAFFPSISQARVRAVFDSLGYPPRVSRVMTGLCTTSTPPDVLARLPFDTASRLRGSHLPQGAPTSPALANLVAYRLDRRLTGLARSSRAEYTRYADDLAFSGVDLAADRLISAVGRIAADEGFSVHPRKTRIMRAHRRQHLAGLVINSHAQAARTEYDQLRALLFNSLRTGPDLQNRDGRPYFREHVYGRIAWIGESNPNRKRALLALADRIEWTG
ncbi:RNA-directed DNA polymerase [Rhodococcus sp. ZPP]|uniref:reverse transcriptase family protein n=1 Tax=Rhodococcus sp. ZPP TaxID=2749906 RepID=UPI001AD85330|nr:reverse transcriptase family protein [Rhodococcus sp. ZPP]QTJ66512.1 RNA-directed DNA polymerase [Rhodococcus sp. ZPP]